MNNEEVGKISYSVTIDVAALKSGAKSAEQAIKTSFSSSERALTQSNNNMQRSIDTTTKSLVSLAAAMLVIRKGGDFLAKSIEDANAYQRSMLGLASVARGFNVDQQAALQAAEDFSADGLIPLTQSADAFKNALQSGFTLEQTITLLNALKDQATNNRQAYYDLGGAVSATIQGIRLGNSVLSDASGNAKNLSVIAKEAGIGIDQMGSVSQNTAYRMAIFNEFTKDAARSTGDAARLSEQAAGADAKLETAKRNLRIEVGNLANEIRKGPTLALADFIDNNEQAIISVAAGTAGMVAFAAAITVLPKLYAATSVAIAYFQASSILATRATAALIAGNVSLSTSLLALRANIIRTQLAMGAFGLASIAIGLVVGGFVSNMLDASDSTEDLGESTEDLSAAQTQAAETSKELTEKLKDLDDQIKKTNRDYRESLKRIVQNHEDSVKSLTKQIEDENEDYEAAVRKRFAVFQDEQGKEEAEHKDKVRALQTQIDFLSRYNNDANRRRLSELQFTLARENAEYEKRNAERLEVYRADEDAEKLSYEKRLQENQGKLNEELAFLNKHREDVLSVRNLILLDEIEMLKRQREEQLASYEKQRQDIVSKYAQAGAEASNAFKQAFGEQGIFFDTPTKWDVQKVGNKTVVTPQFDTGGFTGRGGVKEPAGTVHKGEFVLPQPLVDQATGLPKPEAVAAMSGGGGPAYGPITLKLTHSPAILRQVAMDTIALVNEVMRARGLPQIGVA